MQTLDDLLRISGVVAAGEFSPDGRLVDYRATIEMTPEMASMAATLCAPVNVMFETLASEFMRYSGMQWLPMRGWAYSGGEWTVAIGGNRGVFVATASADFNELFKALVGGR
jgi:roadblock/LC7 domain-containing protein